MSRPKIRRKVCCLPHTNEFVPVMSDMSSGENADKNDAVILTVDEYETVRLIDYQNFTQEECCRYMKIARTTVQQIYNNARKKIAVSLVEGRLLRIDGGDYRLCDGKEEFCACGGCRKHGRSF